MLSVAQIAAQGEAIYDRRLRGRENDRWGQFALIAVDGDFEVDADEEKAAARLRARHPDAVFYVKKIGFDATETVGSGDPTAP